ncbi:MAG: chemotaxis protein CheX [Spartobacteria bacterium]|nr:chemotaxis protein CheX [Spartobacteria bacterium]
MAQSIDEKTSDVTFEEIMFTITSATQDTFSMYMGVELFAGKVSNEITPVESDIVAIVGVGGSRVGYVMIAANAENALKITAKMLMMEGDIEPDAVSDAFGELANNIAGVFKNKYAETYGRVAMGLPLVVTGKIKPLSSSGGGDPKSVNIQQKGASIPFLSMEDNLSFHVIVYF